MNILVLFDGSKPAIKALSYVHSFLTEDSKLVVIYVVDTDRIDDIRELAESAGMERGKVDQMISDLEVKIRKQLREFFNECEKLHIHPKCIFTIGKISDKLLEETSKGDYDILVIPLGDTFKEKILGILDKIIQGYAGNILIVQ